MNGGCLLFAHVMQLVQHSSPLGETCRNINDSLVAGTAKTQHKRPFGRQKRTVHQNIQFLQKRALFGVGQNLFIGIR